MILLILGWNLTAIGILAMILSLVCGFGGVSCLIFGLGAFVVGLLMSILLRKACSSFQSDPVAKNEANAPLDYY